MLRLGPKGRYSLCRYRQAPVAIMKGPPKTRRADTNPRWKHCVASFGLEWDFQTIKPGLHRPGKDCVATLVAEAQLQDFW